MACTHGLHAFLGEKYMILGEGRAAQPPHDRTNQLVLKVRPVEPTNPFARLNVSSNMSCGWEKLKSGIDALFARRISRITTLTRREVATMRLCQKKIPMCVACTCYIRHFLCMAMQSSFSGLRVPGMSRYATASLPERSAWISSHQHLRHREFLRLERPGG